MDGSTTEQASLDVMGALASRLDHAGGTRLPTAFLTTIARLHDLVGELRPTPDELRAVIEFLTDVGHSADARRQEWVLLADVIGVSTLVEDLHACRPDGATPNTLAGPFYRDDVPEVANGANLSRDCIGVPMDLHGRITALDGAPVAAAMVEVWHANALGRYENQDPDLQPEFNLRGRLRTDATGRFDLTTIKPRGYALPEDGPVGRLLNGLGLRLERPAHIHFRVTAPGFDVLTTHIFDRADPAITRDALFGVKPGLLADFQGAPDAQGNLRHRLDVTFVLARTGHADNPTPATQTTKG
jgi:hydroxyquinol 1,2-dioxygenase